MAVAEDAGPALPPLPHAALQTLLQHPDAWQRFREQHAAPHPSTVTGNPPAASAWALLTNLLPNYQKSPQSPSNPLLLTDGTVLVHVSCTPRWYRLTPDSLGDYQHGTWSAIAPMVGTGKKAYAPRFFSSAVLPDGRVIAEGGEYNTTKCADVETTLGAIYDPIANAWTSVAPPKGWHNVGDASATVLANGSYLQSNAVTAQAAILDPITLTWTEAATAGKIDINNEENWTLLPDGTVLTVDAYVGSSTCGVGSQIYEPGAGRWVNAGSTIHHLAGCSGSFKAFEAPTQILRPDGTVVAFGSTVSKPAQNLPVYTSIYSTSSKTWTAGPNMPSVGAPHYTMADAPAAILPNGTILLAASPGTWSGDGYPSPTHFFIFDGKTFTRTSDIRDSSKLSSYELNFLVLPNGQVLSVETDAPTMQVYTGGCCAQVGWAPVIGSLSSTRLTASGTYTAKGTQFSGLTSGASYGDDSQESTNYPLIRITNKATQHVFYARTFGFTSVSMAPHAASSTSFTLPATIETGASSLVVVANGNASLPKSVTIVP